MGRTVYLDWQGNEIEPPKADPIPITNADSVRSMNDEELAEWFWWMLKYVQGYTDSRCALRDWLKQEAQS